MISASTISAALPAPRKILLTAAMAGAIALAVAMAARAGLFGERPELSATVELNAFDENGNLESLITLTNHGAVALDDLRLEITSGSYSFARGNGVSLSPPVQCDAVLQLGLQERLAASCWKLRPGESLSIRILHHAMEIDDLTLRARAQGYTYRQSFWRPAPLNQEAAR